MGQRVDQALILREQTKHETRLLHVSGPEGEAQLSVFWFFGTHCSSGSEKDLVEGNSSGSGAGEPWSPSVRAAVPPERSLCCGMWQHLWFPSPASLNWVWYWWPRFEAGASDLNEVLSSQPHSPFPLSLRWHTWGLPLVRPSGCALRAGPLLMGKVFPNGRTMSGSPGLQRWNQKGSTLHTR